MKKRDEQIEAKTNKEKEIWKEKIKKEVRKHSQYCPTMVLSVKKEENGL